VTPVPFLDLQADNRPLLAEVRAALDAVVADGHFILGPAVERFEADFAAYLGVRHCVGVNNGTSALHMALLACGVGPGDEVITTPHTWISTSWAVSYVGARPVFVDIDPVTYTLDPGRVAAAITPRTRALLPVHLYGQAADLDPLCRLAEAHGLALIEDTAQAHGARYGGRCAGTFGKAGCFSFYPSKNLGAFGEAGAVVTNDDAVAERVRCLRDHAQRGRHRHVEVGYNTRLEGLQGAVLAVKLRHLDAWNTARRRHADLYRELLAGVPGLVLPAAREPDGHVWHLYVVLAEGVDRESLRQGLAARGVGSGVHYPTPVPLQPAYAALGHRPGDFPVAEGVARQCVSLPMFPGLTEGQVVAAARALRACLEERPRFRLSA
jgi:dTDP-4-amino-4,6-dideoxygalactose transaminase